MAAKVPQHPLSHRVLEVLEELRGGGRGFVKTEAGGGIGWVLIRVILNPLKESVDHAQVVVVRDLRWPDILKQEEARE